MAATDPNLAARLHLVNNMNHRSRRDLFDAFMWGEDSDEVD